MVLPYLMIQFTSVLVLKSTKKMFVVMVDQKALFHMFHHLTTFRVGILVLVQFYWMVGNLLTGKIGLLRREVN